MRNMPITDAFFLIMESRRIPMHVGGLNLFTLPKDRRSAFRSCNKSRRKRTVHTRRDQVNWKIKEEIMKQPTPEKCPFCFDYLAPDDELMCLKCELEFTPHLSENAATKAASIHQEV